ncbi:MAG: glucose-6-phosphate isomerase [Flavobacteriaceae bacterium]|nr:glucose-6-phosphate isomerase [Flavobacteriaceae bacterium]
MSLKKIDPTKTKSWDNLNSHYKTIKSSSISDFFKENPFRSDDFKIEWEDFYVDFSKNIINSKTIKLLIELCKEVDLKNSIDKYFGGVKINSTENRSVLHTALRSKEKIFLENIDISKNVKEVKSKLKKFSNKIISGKFKSSSEKKITDIVNIGIGGSDLGPIMVTHALKHYSNHLKIHFISNVDGDHVVETLKKIDPETTLFIIVSKTFTTQETITNANSVKKWFLSKYPNGDVSKHFIAVSSSIEKAKKFGISENYIFPMEDWVGGRFSIWGSVGLSIMLSIGPDNFEEILEGAYEMDQHFKDKPFEENIPVILALISIWYNNFFNAETEVVIPYSEYLKLLPSYLQQAVMESNGKNYDRNGNPVSYETGNIIWGSTGTNSQHAFFQLLHQGTKFIPSDFIGFIEPLNNKNDHHEKLMSNFFAQTEALMNGKTEDEVLKELNELKYSEDNIKRVLPFKIFQGNKPSNSILINKLTPKSLGKLICLYEHKIFVQGVIWNIFSFDQWGVELGKKLANNILNEIQSDIIFTHDESTKNLIKKFKKNS